MADATASQVGGISFTIGGSPDSIRAVADWIEEKLTPAVARLVQVVKSDPDIDPFQLTQFSWSDEASKIFYGKMLEGSREARTLVDMLDNLVDVLRETADQLGQAQVRIGQGLAALGGSLVRVEDGVMRHPDITEIEDPGGVRRLRESTGISYDDDLVAYGLAASSVERAGDTVDAQLKKLIEEVTTGWRKVIIVSGWTATTTAVLAQNRFNTVTRPLPARQPQEPGKMHRGRPYGSRISDTGRPSTVVAAAKRAGYLVAIVGTVYEIHQGAPPAKAIGTTLVSLGASAGVTLAITAFLVPAGAATALVGLALAAAVGTVAGWAAGELYGMAYDAIFPQLAWDKLVQ